MVAPPRLYRIASQSRDPSLRSQTIRYTEVVSNGASGECSLEAEVFVNTCVNVNGAHPTLLALRYANVTIFSTQRVPIFSVPSVRRGLVRDFQRSSAVSSRRKILVASTFVVR